MTLHGEGSAKIPVGKVPAVSGLAAWWQDLTGKAHSHAQNVAKHVSKTKWGMPVDVKVDFLRPTYETIKETATAVWVQLPPQVQVAAPYVGVGVASGLVVFALQQRRVGHHQRREEELGAQIKVLRSDRDALMKRINLLKAKSGSPRSEVEARMALAIAEATNAAAAAADAAARAATACIFNPAMQPPASEDRRLAP